MFRPIHDHPQGVLFKALSKVKVICWPSFVYRVVCCVWLRWWCATILIQCNLRILKTLCAFVGDNKTHISTKCTVKKSKTFRQLSHEQYELLRCADLNGR
jgi:hypothetical protein